MAKPVAVTSTDITLTQTVIGPSTTQALGTSTGVDSQGGRSIQSFAWYLVSKPSGSSATLLSATTQTPTLSGIDVWGNYLMFLRVTDSYGEISEADPSKSPASAFQVVRVQSTGLSLEKTASGERNWSDNFHKVVAAVESLNGSFGKISGVQPLSGTKATAPMLDKLITKRLISDMHMHSGTDITQATQASRGAVTLSYTPLSITSPRVPNRVCGAWHAKYDHMTGDGTLASKCTVKFTGNPATDLTETLTLISTDGTVVEYRANLSSDFTYGNNHFRADEVVANIAGKLKLAIDDVGGHDGKLVVADDGAGELTITQAVPGDKGDTYLFSNLANTEITSFSNGGRGNILQSGDLEEEILAAFPVVVSNLYIDSFSVSSLEARTYNPVVIEFRLLTDTEYKAVKTFYNTSGTALSSSGTFLGSVTLQHSSASDTKKPLSGYAEIYPVACAQGSVIVVRATGILEETQPFMDISVTDYVAIPSADTFTLTLNDRVTATVSASTVNTTWNATTSNLITAQNIASWVNTSVSATFAAGSVTLDTSTAVKSSGTITVIDFTELNATDSITLISTGGTSTSFAETAAWEATVSNNQTASNMASAITANAAYTATAAGPVVTVQQNTAGPTGNTTVTLVDTGTAGMSKTDFTGGTDGTATFRLTAKAYGSLVGQASTVVMGTGGGITLGTSGSATTSTFRAGGYSGEDYTNNSLDFVVNWKKRY